MVSGELEKSQLAFISFLYQILLFLVTGKIVTVCCCVNCEPNSLVTCIFDSKEIVLTENFIRICYL